MLPLKVCAQCGQPSPTVPHKILGEHVDEPRKSEVAAPSGLPCCMRAQLSDERHGTSNSSPSLHQQRRESLHGCSSKRSLYRGRHHPLPHSVVCPECGQHESGGVAWRIEQWEVRTAHRKHCRCTRVAGDGTRARWWRALVGDAGVIPDLRSVPCGRGGRAPERSGERHRAAGADIAKKRETGLTFRVAFVPPT